MPQLTRLRDQMGRLREENRKYREVNRAAEFEAATRELREQVCRWFRPIHSFL